MPIIDTETSITICACASREIIDRTEIIQLVSALKNAGYTVTVVPDLCKTAISNTEEMTAIASTAVVACYPRAVRSIFDSVGLKPEHIFDIRNNSSEQVLSEMEISTNLAEFAIPPPHQKMNRKHGFR